METSVSGEQLHYPWLEKILNAKRISAQVRNICRGWNINVSAPPAHRCNLLTEYFDRLIFSVFYWYIWIRVLPRWKGYTIEEEFDFLEDGTTVTRLVKVYG